MLSDYENSNSNGYPVELFEFSAEGVTYRYAHHDDEVDDADGVTTWAPGMFSRTNFTKGPELAQSGVKVSMTTDPTVLQIFSDGPPEGAVELTIYRTHLTDPDKEKWIIWQGQVVSLKRVGRGVELSCEPHEATLRSVGLRRRFQTTCPYPLYGVGCFVDRSDHFVTTTVQSAGSQDIKVGTTNCLPFIGGMLYQYEAGQERYRFIMNAGTNSVSITRPASWLKAGDEVRLYKGCNKTVETCSGVFNNLYNFGGMPHMPKSNLFNTKVF